MAKKHTEENKVARKQKHSQQEQLANLLKLRRMGVLTRHQFRLMCYVKGLNQNPNKGPGVPMVHSYELVKDKSSVSGKRLVEVFKPWERFTK